MNLNAYPMRKTILVLCCLIQTTVGFSQKTSAWTLFNGGWEFVRDADTVISAALFIRSEKGNPTWQSVTLPHTARLEPLVLKANQWQGTCLYRKFFKVSTTDQGKRLSVYFEAAMNDADVYLNGKWIGNHPGGYLPFEAVITGKIKPGKENCLLIKLNNRDNPQIPPGKPLRTLDFNFYSGLYRNVYWVAQEKLHFPDAVASNRKSGGAAMIHFENVSPESAKILVATEIKNDYQKSKPAQIRWTLSDIQGKILSQGFSENAEIGTGAYHTFHTQIVVSKPNLWSPDQPYLYALRIDLVSEGKLIEQMNLRSGIRSVKFATDGFYLNGTKLRIRGTNRHQEYPYVGYALPDQAQFRDAWKIKEAGFNFVRCSHYPPAIGHAVNGFLQIRTIFFRGIGRFHPELLNTFPIGNSGKYPEYDYQNSFCFHLNIFISNLTGMVTVDSMGFLSWNQEDRRLQSGRFSLDYYIFACTVCL